MKKTPRREKYLLSPYLFSLVCILLSLLMIGNGIMLSIWLKNTKGLPLAAAMSTGDAFGCCFVFSLTLLALAIFLYNGYEYFGSVEIASDRLIFRGPFCRPRTFLCEELADIGIDYGVISGTRQFWIYFSKRPIEKKYTHNIIRLPYSAETMRIQYRKSLYDALMRRMPYDNVGRRLSRSHSVIVLFDAEDEQ